MYVLYVMAWLQNNQDVQKRTTYEFQKSKEYQNNMKPGKTEV